jgi:purine-binding chemotaxis protein CheW
MTQGSDQQTINMILVFRLEGEAFGVSVGIVQEILDPLTPTPVPNAGPFAPGVINVRGVVVPVVDIRGRLGMTHQTQCDTARMIVIEHDVAGSLTKLAFQADAVEQVVEADIAALEKVPDLGSSWPQTFLKGALRRDDEMIILLETETLFEPCSHSSAA